MNRTPPLAMPAMRTPVMPSVGHSAVPPQPSRLPSFREVVNNALFPFMVDTWLRDQRIFFCRLAILLRAGIPLYQALASISETTRNPRMKAPILDACRTVSEGGMLSDSFARFSDTFSELQIALLRAGEIHGRLEVMLQRITLHIETELELRRALSRQTLYPKIILVFGLFLIPFLLGLLMGANVIGLVTDTVSSVVQLVVFCSAAFCIGRTWMARSPQVRETYETIKWRIPVVGSISRTFALSRFAHALSSLYSAGVNLPTSLRIAADASTSHRVGKMAETAAQASERGEPIVPWMRAAGFVPENMLNLLDSGFASGEVDQMMGRAAEYLQSEAETNAHKLSYVLGQALFLLVALIVTKGLFLQIIPIILSAFGF